MCLYWCISAAKVCNGCSLQIKGHAEWQNSCDYRSQFWDWKGNSSRFSKEECTSTHGLPQYSEGERAVTEVRKKSNNDNVVFRQLDLASFTSIRKFATEVLEEEKQLDVLINNAGVFMLPLRRTKDGVEMHFGVNYLGHFLLTNLLLERLKEAPGARIVNVAADVPSWLAGINFDDINSEKSYNRVKAVIQSKLSVIASSTHFAQQLADTRVTINTVHPGIVRNDFGRYLDYWYGYFQVG